MQNYNHVDTEKFPSGKVKAEVYSLKHGPDDTNYVEMLHRTDGPARIEYYESGNIQAERYYQLGNKHRSDAPAIISYYESKNKKEEHYYSKGQRHRMDGPASIVYNENNEIVSEEYFVRNQPLQLSAFVERMRKSADKTGELQAILNEPSGGPKDTMCLMLANIFQEDIDPGVFAQIQLFF